MRGEWCGRGGEGGAVREKAPNRRDSAPRTLVFLAKQEGVL
jgi:hypothetical protein